MNRSTLGVRRSKVTIKTTEGRALINVKIAKGRGLITIKITEAYRIIYLLHTL